MGVTWTSYSVLPFAIGGAGRVRAVLGGDPVDAVAAVAVASSAPAPTSPDAVGVSRLDLVHIGGPGEWRGNFFGWSKSSINIHFFAHTAAGWQGPKTIPAALPWRYTEADFPWIRPWVVDRLQEIADRLAPLGSGQRVKVSGVFPEDTVAFPIVTVQVDSVAPAGESIGRVMERHTDGTIIRGTLYNLSFSVVAWTNTPEERDDLAAWMGQAMEVLVEILPAVECMEPSASIEESEDFQTLDVPTFLVTARLNTSRWSRLAAPPISEFGHLSV